CRAADFRGCAGARNRRAVRLGRTRTVASPALFASLIFLRSRLLRRARQLSGKGFILLVFSLTGASALAQTNGWVFPTANWDTSRTPESLGLDHGKLDLFKANMGA